MSTDTQYLTLEETAKHLNVTVRAIRSWIDRRKIEHVKMGKYIRFRKSYIEQWVEKQTIKANKKIA